MLGIFKENLQQARQLAIAPIETARQYSLNKFRSDMLAGLTVSVVAIPQAMAFALIAQVPPIYGLYGLMIQCFLGSLFTSSSRLSIGPTNTISLLTASIAGGMVDATGPEYLGIVVGLTAISGVIQIFLGVARMGGLVRYVSHAVIVGFTAGAGVLIAMKQVPNFFGIPTAEASHNLPELPRILAQIFPNITQINLAAVVVGIISLLTVLVVRRINRLLPAPLFAVVVGSLIVVIMGWQGAGSVEDAIQPGEVQTGTEMVEDADVATMEADADVADDAELALVGELPDQLIPRLTMPTLDWPTFRMLLGGGLAIALLGLIEAVAIGKALAARNGERIDADQEFFAQGLTNFFSSFLSCYPGTGSFSRSALNDAAGAQTRFAGTFNAIFVLLILLLFSPLAQYIALASLAAILFIVAYGLIDWRYFLRVARTDNADAWVCIGTFVATLLAPLEYAVFIGIFFNIGLYLRRASRLHMAEMVRSKGGPLHERPLKLRNGDQRSVLFIQLEGDLFFGVADELQDRLHAIENSGVRVVIMRLKRTHWMDSTVLHVLEEFVKSMRMKDRYVLICGVQESMYEKFQNFGLLYHLGEENVFMSSYGVFSSAKRAIARGKKLLGHSIDQDMLAEESDESYENWTYQI